MKKSQHMNNRKLHLLPLGFALLLTDCSGEVQFVLNSTEETPQPETEQIIQRYVESPYKAETEEIVNPAGEYYEYNGAAYWHDYEYFTGLFVESSGKYMPVLNEGETLSQALESYPIVELMVNFDPQDYSYVGSLDTENGSRNEFYLRNDGEFMLHICDVFSTDAEIAENEKTVAAEVLSPSPLPKE